MKNAIPFLAICCIILSACQPKQQPNLTPEETTGYLEKGKETVRQSFMTLSGQLAGAMQEGGVQNAVSYCNLNANPIVDSLSEALHVKISRVTNRPRNQENMADKDELEILADYLKVISLGESLEPFVLATSKTDVTYYAPITIISPLCLKCHGNIGTDILQEDYDLIRSLYPEDQATGYKMKELRGLWKVEFDQL